MSYKGVLIEESLNDTSILPKLNSLATKTTTLEGEENRGAFHFHNVEVTEENVGDVLKFISEHIKTGWYFHLVRDNEMIVIFHNKIMKAHNGNTSELEAIRSYGKSQSILEEQLPTENLINNPFS